MSRKKYKGWNYRIFRYKDKVVGEWFGLHEVYYTSGGKIKAWTSEPSIVGVNKKEIIGTLKLMMEGAKKSISIPTKKYEKS